MGRYVALSGWAEQKTSRESCCGKTAIHHACQPEFRRAKNGSFALRRLGQNREANRVRRSLPVMPTTRKLRNTSAFRGTDSHNLLDHCRDNYIAGYDARLESPVNSWN